MKRLILTATAASLFVTAARAASCNADNCLRGLRNSAVITRAVAFCSTYTAAVGAPTATALPSYAAACSDNPARIASACACLSLSTTATPTVTPTITPSQPTSCPVSVSTSTVTSVTTVTAGGPAVAGPPGASNVPNGLFETGDGSSDWCGRAQDSVCRIVGNSTDGRFSGLFGPGMLQVSLGNEAFANFAVPVPAVLYPHPSGRDWTLTAVYRAPAGNPGRCWPILGWTSAAGGFGTQPSLREGDDGWQAVRRTLPGSAGGTNILWSVYVIAGCEEQDGEGLYVDGVAIG